MAHIRRTTKSRTSLMVPSVISVRPRLVVQIIVGPGLRPTVVFRDVAAAAPSVLIAQITMVGVTASRGGPQRHGHRVPGGLPPAVQVPAPLRLILRRLLPAPPLGLGRAALAGVLRRAQAHVLVRFRVGRAELGPARLAAVEVLRHQARGMV